MRSGCDQSDKESATCFVLIGRSHGELGRFTAHSLKRGQVRWDEMRWVIWTLIDA